MANEETRLPCLTFLHRLTCFAIKIPVAFIVFTQYCGLSGWTIVAIDSARGHQYAVIIVGTRVTSHSLIFTVALETGYFSLTIY